MSINSRPADQRWTVRGRDDRLQESMTGRIKRAIDWAFAITFLFAVIFVMNAVVSLVYGGGEIDVQFGPYVYKGPFYGCWPLMVIGLASLGGCVMYVILSFAEGRDIARWEAQRRGIEDLRGETDEEGNH